MDPLHGSVSEWLCAAGIGRGERLLAAVSGGADSLALLRVLAALGQRAGAAHVHHGARGAQADGDEAAVRAAAGALGVPFHGARVQVPPGRPGSWEARARAERYAALERLRAEHGYAWIATAHTLDDQAETVLMRALRGSLLEGLAGIDPLCRERHLLRPLLAQRRAQLRAYLRRRGAAWREDASNRDERRLRARLRARLLPLLEELSPGALPRLAALADDARGLRASRAVEHGAWLGAAARPDEGGRWVCARALAELAPEQRRSALAALLRASCPPERLRRLHLERALAFAQGALPGARLSLPGGCALLRARSGFWIGRGPGPRRGFR